MTIALDATYSLGDELSGVGRYSREILWGLARAHPEACFQFCYRSHRYWRSWKEDLPPNASRRLLAEPLGPRTAGVFHGLNQRLPRFPLRCSVATFHDLFVLTGDYSTPEFRARFAAQAKDAAARADAIVAVSAFTKRQVVDLLGVAAAKVFVVHHGTTALAYPKAPRQNIVLTVGAVQARKNTARLIEAFGALDSSWRMVIAGSAGFGAEAILAQAAEDPRISITGYVSPESLGEWYARASIFAFPSLDEGFGMPVLEAMAAGVPVITSNRSALPEVAGDAALLVNPEDTSALARALVQLSENGQLREALIERGFAHARGFTWEKAVQETWAIYGLLSDSRRQPRS